MTPRFLALATALAASTLACGSALAHSKLVVSTPADGAVLSAAPAQLRFQFNEAVEPAVSSIHLTGPDSRPVALDKVEADKDDAKAIAVKLPALAAGEYHAEWATAGHDGHRVKGDIRFTVK